MNQIHLIINHLRARQQKVAMIKIIILIHDTNKTKKRDTHFRAFENKCRQNKEKITFPPSAPLLGHT